jgi:hypothetical protein
MQFASRKALQTATRKSLNKPMSFKQGNICARFPEVFELSSNPLAFNFFCVKVPFCQAMLIGPAVE